MSQNRALLTDEGATGAAITVGIGGAFTFMVDGTFGGATVSLQVQGGAGNWLDIGGDASMTAAGVCLVDLSPGSYRAAVSGGAPSGLYASIQTLD